MWRNQRVFASLVGESTNMSDATRRQAAIEELFDARQPDLPPVPIADALAKCAAMTGNADWLAELLMSKWLVGDDFMRVWVACVFLRDNPPPPTNEYLSALERAQRRWPQLMNSCVSARERSSIAWITSTTKGAVLDRQIQELRRTIVEAAVWCSHRRVGPHTIERFRSPELAPDVLSGTRLEVVRSVVRARRTALDRTPHDPDAVDLRDGRVLFFDPDGTLSDGAARVATNGLFGDDNSPPWDTWIEYVYQAPVNSQSGPFTTAQSGVLLAWIPPALEEIAQAGIAHNPEQCIGWLDESSYPIADHLRDNGVIRAARSRRV